MILSIDENERLKRRDRKAVAVEDLSDREIAAIREADPPAEATRHDRELAAERGTDT